MPQDSLADCPASRTSPDQPAPLGSRQGAFPRSYFLPIRSAHSLTPPNSRSISPLRQPCKVHRRLWNRAGYGPRNGMGPVVLPRVGLRSDVLHLSFLLPGAGLLRGEVPTPDETPVDAACQPETPGQPGRTARSPGPATGLPEKVPPPARDGSYFRPPPPIRQYQKTMDETAKKAALLGGISASAAIEAVSSRHPARLHCVWAHAGVIGPERGAVIDERNGSTARRCSRSKPRMNFGRRRRQVNRWNSRMNSLHPKEAHFDVWEKEEG